MELDSKNRASFFRVVFFRTNIVSLQQIRMQAQVKIPDETVRELPVAWSGLNWAQRLTNQRALESSGSAT